MSDSEFGCYLKHLTDGKPQHNNLKLKETVDRRIACMVHPKGT